MCAPTPRSRKTNWSRAVGRFICKNSQGDLVAIVSEVDISNLMLVHRREYLASTLNSDVPSRKVATYKLMRGDSYVLQPYLSVFTNLHQRRILCQFITGSHWLHVQTGRFSKERTEFKDRICEQCNSGSVEDEAHFLFYCPKYISLREKYRDIFEGVQNDLNAFFQQNSIRVAKFLTECRNFRA